MIRMRITDQYRHAVEFEAATASQFKRALIQAWQEWRLWEETDKAKIPPYQTRKRAAYRHATALHLHLRDEALRGDWFHVLHDGRNLLVKDPFGHWPDSDYQAVWRQVEAAAEHGRQLAAFISGFPKFIDPPEDRRSQFQVIEGGDQ